MKGRPHFLFPDPKGEGFLARKEAKGDAGMYYIPREDLFEFCLAALSVGEMIYFSAKEGEYRDFPLNGPLNEAREEGTLLRPAFKGPCTREFIRGLESKYAPAIS